MISRRVFAGCGLCAALGLLAEPVAAQSANPGFTRTELGRAPVGATEFDTIEMAIALEAGATVPRHTHPGTESGTLVDGEATVSIQGQPDRHLKPGDTFFITTGTPHSVANGNRATKLVSTYVVERGKPLASPA